MMERVLVLEDTPVKFVKYHRHLVPSHRASTEERVSRKQFHNINVFVDTVTMEIIAKMNLDASQTLVSMEVYAPTVRMVCSNVHVLMDSRDFTVEKRYHRATSIPV